MNPPSLMLAVDGNQRSSRTSSLILGPDDDSPRVLRQFGSHEGSSMGRPRTPSPTATCCRLEGLGNLVYEVK